MKKIAAKTRDASFQVAGHISLGLVGHCRQLAQISFHIQVWILIARQRERHFGEIHRRMRIG